LFPSKEPILDFLDPVLELGYELQNLPDGLFGGDISSGPLAKQGFEWVGAQENLLSHDFV
jgi:hypothetical protein